MIITSLELHNFRNYRELKLSFDPGVNIIYGENAQGKTNILEAVYLCATSKSHRTSADKEMILLDEKEGEVHLAFETGGMTETVDVHLRRSGKKAIAVNKMPVRRMSELLGILHIVLFSPEDLGLIKHGPRERRRFMDLELSQLDALYFHELSQYHRILKQRNSLLKQLSEGRAGEEMLDAWDLQLAGSGEKVIRMRQAFIDELSPAVSEKHRQLTGGREILEMAYEKNAEADAFADKLHRARRRDMKLGMTSVGPHRDDLAFSIDGKDARTFGSQGQQRTAALALKLSEIDLVLMKSDETPVLLLDDVLSELDESRQLFLVEHLKELQTIITCTGIEDAIHNKLGPSCFIRVENATAARE